VVSLPTNRGAPARNVGVRLADTPYVAFADDDSWWEAGSLHGVAQMLDQHPQLGLLVARIVVGPEQRLDPVCLDLAASPLKDPTLPGRPVLGFVDCAAMVRVEAFRAAGGFDDIIRFPGEEARLAMDLAAGGWQLAYLDELLVHHHPSGPRDPRAREAAIVRSRLLTAVMRWPWRRVVPIAIQSASAGPTTRSGLHQALPALPAALRARRVLPAHVLDVLDLIGREGARAQSTTAGAGKTIGGRGRS
jgi:Predicted glycosyltransferases